MWTPPINESAELTRGALYLIQYSEAFPDWGPQAEDSATKLCMCTVYGVLFSPLWLKIVPDCPAISVSSW
jgi:hypothetical protein